MKSLEKQIFNYISGINPTESTVSSLGSFVSDLNQQIADELLKEIITELPKNTLAYKIATSTTKKFSDKQLWVITFELSKNDFFSDKVISFFKKIKEEEKSKRERKSYKQAKKREIKKNFETTKKANDFEVDTKINHPKFGNGVVTFSDENNIKISFDEIGEKTLVKAFVKLTKI